MRVHRHDAGSRGRLRLAAISILRGLYALNALGAAVADAALLGAHRRDVTHAELVLLVELAQAVPVAVQAVLVN